MSNHSIVARRAALTLALLLAPATRIAAQLPGIPALPPVSITAAPAILSIIVAQRNTITVSGRTSSGTAFVPSSDAVFTVDVGDRSVVSAPATVTMLHGQSVASLTLTGLAAGSTAVTLRFGGLAASASVSVMGVDGSTVPAQPPASVTLAPLVATLPVGGRLVVSATVRTATGTTLTGRTLAWRSATPAVASVSSAGVVTAVAPGTSVVTAADGGVSGSMTVSVAAPTPVSSPTTPVAVASVAITPASELSILAGLPFHLHATVLDAAGQSLTGRAVTWTSSNATSVRVATDGTVVGVSGSATITATCEGRSATLPVTVVRSTTTRTAEAP